MELAPRPVLFCERVCVRMCVRVCVRVSLGRNLTCFLESFVLDKFGAKTGDTLDLLVGWGGDEG